MRVAILAVGHRMPAWIQEGFHEYAKRMPPEIRIELTELKPEPRDSGVTVDKARGLEGRRLLEAAPPGSQLIALDERGRTVTTQGLAVMLAGWMREGTAPAFIIGGADGLSDEVRERAGKIVSLSALTLPHGLARVLLAEQLYRAWTILARHPYHRD